MGDRKIFPGLPCIPIQTAQVFIGNCARYLLSYIISLNPYKVFFPLLFEGENKNAKRLRKRVQGHTASAAGTRSQITGY